MVDYYLDAVSGNDTNTGLFGSPWKTFDRVNQAVPGTFTRSDRILGRAGQEYFGFADFSTLRTAASGAPQFQMGVWGHGPAPKLNGYKISLDGWEAVEAGIWRLNITANSSQITGNITSTSTDVGHLRDGETYRGQKRDRLVSSFETINSQQVLVQGLVNEWDFYSDATYLYVKKASSPGAGLRIAVRQNGVTLGSYTDVTGWHILGHGGHGVLGSDTNQNNVTNNVIEAIGGSYIPGSTVKPPTRFGNGVEAYLGARSMTVTGNYIMQTYDSGFTAQGPMNSGGGAQDVIVARNYFDRCAQSIEFWSQNVSGSPSFRRVRVVENVAVAAGESWSASVRPDNTGKGIHILTYDLQGTVDVVIRRNVFHTAKDALAWYRQVPPAGFVVTDNSVYLPATKKITWQDTQTMASPGANPYIVGSRRNVLPSAIATLGDVLAASAAEAAFATEVSRYWRATTVAA